MNTCYKVVSTYREGKKYGSCSLFPFNDYFLQYKILKITKPKIGFIFVFDTLGSAEIFINDDKYWTVLFCKCGKMIKANVRLEDKDELLIQRFWSKGLREYNGYRLEVVRVPRGTYFTSWVIPIKEVK